MDTVTSGTDGRQRHDRPGLPDYILEAPVESLCGAAHQRLVLLSLSRSYRHLCPQPLRNHVMVSSGDLEPLKHLLELQVLCLKLFGQQPLKPLVFSIKGGHFVERDRIRGSLGILECGH